MAHGRFFRPDFDRGRDFVALRPFTYSGQEIVPGQPIAKADYTDRRLRQLYDMRNICYPEEYWQNFGHNPPGATPPTPVKPEEPVPAPVRRVIERYRPQTTSPSKQPIQRRRLSTA
jgi:hypothetical protein